MRHARVRLHLAGDETGREHTLSALGGARHFLRRELASRLRLFRVPELHFEADLETESSARFDQVLKRTRKGRPRNAGEERKSSLE